RSRRQAGMPWRISIETRRGRLNIQALKRHIHMTYFRYLTVPLLFLIGSLQAAESAGSGERAQMLFATRATYCSAPRKPDGRVDTERLVSELVEVGANTYSFCIHAYATDWDDLQLILPRARERGIRVWGSIVPPSESPPRVKAYAEPFRLDYQRWAVE